MSVPRIQLSFYGDTREVLRNPPQEGCSLTYPLHRRASIKDIVEGLGLPHSEVGAIILANREQTFDLIPAAGDHFHIHPLSPATSPLHPTTLRPTVLPDYAFMVDINVNRLAGLLRMTGFDAQTAPGGTDAELIAATLQQQRILLSRNRELLRHRLVLHGRLLRTEDSDKQLAEIIHLYHLQRRIRPFSRCMRCNGLLREVLKEQILDELLPLTKRYYTNFKRCADCNQIYWRGSHHQHMLKKLHLLLQ